MYLNPGFQYAVASAANAWRRTSPSPLRIAASTEWRVAGNRAMNTVILTACYNREDAAACAQPIASARQCGRVADDRVRAVAAIAARGGASERAARHDRHAARGSCGRRRRARA